MSERNRHIDEVVEEVYDLGDQRQITKRTYRYLGVGDYPLKDFAFVFEDESGDLICRAIQSYGHHATWDFQLPGYVMGRAEYTGMERFIPTISSYAKLSEKRLVEDPNEIQRFAEDDQILSFSLNGWLLRPEDGCRVYFEAMENDVIYPKPGFEILRAHLIPKARKIRIHFQLHDGFEAIAYVKDIAFEESYLGSNFETDRIEISINGQVIQYLNKRFWDLEKWLNISGKGGSQVIEEANRMIERNWIQRSLKKPEESGDPDPGL